MVDFASSSGQFLIASFVIDFGSDLQITAASDNGGVPDPSVLGFSLELDPVLLTGSFSNLLPALDIWFFEIDATPTYQLRIFDSTHTLALRADYDPGTFVAVTASGVLAPVVAPEVTNLVNFFPGTYPSLDALAAGLSLDLSVVLSAAGQNVGQLVSTGAPVQGSVAGTIVVTEVPEPGTLALVSLGLAGLAWQGWRRNG